jgi:hypothetical protein
MELYKQHKDYIRVQAASLTVMMGWYPFYYAKLQKEVTAVTKNVSSYNYLKAGLKPGFFRSMIIPLAFQPVFPVVFGISNIIEKKLCMFPIVYSANTTFEEKLKIQHINSNIAYFSSKFIAGCATGPFANVLMTYQISAQNTGKLLPAIRTVGLDVYRGIIPMTLRNGFFALGIFGLYPFFEKTLNKTNIGEIPSALAAGIIPALVSSTLTMPFDNVATQRQSIGAKIAPNRSTFEVISNIIKLNGYRGLFIGGAMRFCSTYIEIVAFNQVLKLYQQYL